MRNDYNGGLRYLNNWITKKETVWIYLGEYGDHSISLASVFACEEKTSQAKSKHITKVIKNGNTTLTVYYKNMDNETNEMNFHEMALEDLEKLKEYLLDSRNIEELSTDRGDLNNRILLIDKAIVNKKQQQLNG